VTFLIDGYNLMHAIGLASRGMPAGGLHRGRGRLLNWLADSIRDRTDELCVVFDSRSPVSEKPQDLRGIRVRFSDGQTADEWIEAAVRTHPRPAELGVVSNDRQVREAGRVRGCSVLRCEEFVDWLQAAPASAPGRTAPRAPGKIEPEATDDEKAAWLEAFSTPKPRRPRP
jgi:predicted RNA-binding protein with PIN domain